MKDDILGNALNDYFQGTKRKKLLLHTSYGDMEEMPIEVFFRQPDDFPELEHIALALCDGSVLDVGAGVGSHALYLQAKGMQVHALEISPQACAIMQKRGVQHIIQRDFFDHTGQKYDTLLFLMNGVGLAGSLNNLKDFLNHCKSLLNSGGQLLFDSSDIDYLYADGSVKKPRGYYGEIRYRYEYKNQKSQPFDWLFVDQETLIHHAHAEGWVVQELYEDEDGHYLVRMEHTGSR